MARKFAFLLTRHFTLSPLALFVDTLRLAGDEQDRSRRVEFDWQVLGERGLPIQSSCGIDVMPTRGLQNPEQYDDVVVVGGLLNTGDVLGSQKEAFLMSAASRGIRLTALCTASFVLARYGLLDGYNVSVSWLHVKDFRTAFPQVSAHADSLFSVDGSRATCAGGVGAADLAGHFVAESIGRKASEKAAKILILDRVRTIRDVQPVGDLFPSAESRQLRRALLLMESNVHETLGVSNIAGSLGVSRRQLERLFLNETGMSPLAAYLAIRLHYAKTLLEVSDLHMSEIGFRCGFTNAGHFSRAFKRQTGQTPTEFRNASRALNPDASRRFIMG
ncbi:MAG: GlxA family transcriptional regulator [Mesorhizobium sp.]